MLAATFAVCLKPLQAIWIQIKTDRTSVLIWIQTEWHSNSVSERIFLKVNFEKKSVDDNKSMKKLPSMHRVKLQLHNNDCLEKDLSISTIVEKWSQHSNFVEKWSQYKWSKHNDLSITNLVWKWSQHSNFVEKWSQHSNYLHRIDISIATWWRNDLSIVIICIEIQLCGEIISAF